VIRRTGPQLPQEFLHLLRRELLVLTATAGFKGNSSLSMKYVTISLGAAKDESPMLYEGTQDQLRDQVGHVIRSS
jgi:hypothetical protein